MPLELITGPANAGKAKHVLDALRARGEQEPVLVVPTYRDYEAYRQELAGNGPIIGPRVMRFSWLANEIAERGGERPRVAGELTRRRLLAAAIRESGAERFVEGGAQALVDAAAGFVDELHESLIEPDRLHRALMAWAGDSRARARDAERIAGMYKSYRELLDTLGLMDQSLALWRALRLLRERPASWGRTPVFLYGFDDLTRAQHELVLALAAVEGVQVTLALTHDDRPGLASRPAMLGELREAAARKVTLGADREYYASGSRDALHHLERRLFRPEGEPVDHGGAVRLLSAAGERAELELVAAEIHRLLDEGWKPDEIAVVMRRPAAYDRLVDETFRALGIPHDRAVTLRLGHTAVGRALAGLLRCAVDERAEARSLLDYLRAPGVVRVTPKLDGFEKRVRQDEITGAAAAIEAWESDNWRLDDLARLRAGARAGTAELASCLAALAHSLLGRPQERRDHPLDEDEVAEARAASKAHEWLEELSSLAKREPRLAGGAAELADELEALEVSGAYRHRPGAVQVLDPTELRARRVRALFVCGLQENEFPARGTPEPFLPDRVRFELRNQTDAPLDLPDRERRLDDERALFYACVTRPSELLVLSHRTSDHENNPLVRSFLIDDVQDLFTELPERARLLGQVEWDEGTAPGLRARRRSQLVERSQPRPLPQAGELPAEVLEELGSREVFSATSLEKYARCPMSWLIDNLLKLEELEGDAEPLRRGGVLHDALRRIYVGLREQAGSARLTEATLPIVLELVEPSLRAAHEEHGLPGGAAKQRGTHHRFARQISAYLRQQAALELPYEPLELELGFGSFAGEEQGHPAFELDERTKLRGRIDRVDVDADGNAVVIDYKTSTGTPRKEWEERPDLQAALYALVVRELLDHRIDAAVYQPIGGDRRPRGAFLANSEFPAPPAVRTDKCDEESLDRLLMRAREIASAAAEGIRSGRFEPHPDTCHFKQGGGCMHPGICPRGRVGTEPQADS